MCADVFVRCWPARLIGVEFFWCAVLFSKYVCGYGLRVRPWAMGGVAVIGPDFYALVWLEVQACVSVRFCYGATSRVAVYGG